MNNLIHQLTTTHQEFKIIGEEVRVLDRLISRITYYWIENGELMNEWLPIPPIDDVDRESIILDMF